MKKFFIFLVIVGALGALAYYNPWKWQFVDDAKDRVVTFFESFAKKETQPFVLKTAQGEVTLALEVADAPDERTKGLMERQSLAEGSGMWFVFDDETPRAFWMKNTLISLDIVFFDKNKKAVSVVENMTPCEEEKPEKCARYFSEKPAMYALEMGAGFVGENGVKIGDEME